MSDLTVASTTDPQNEINKAAGLEPEKEAPKPEPQEGEEPESKATETEAQQEQEHKPKSSYQKRIDRLVRERSERDSKIEELNARLAKLEQGGNGKQPVTEAKVEQPKTEESKLAERPKEDQFATLGEYMEALADWKTEQKLQAIRQEIVAEEQKATRAAAQEALVKSYEERVDAARERYDDFDDFAFKENIPIYDGVRAIIMQDPNGVDLQYYLARNPKIARDLMALPVEMAMAKAGAIAASLGKPEIEETTEEEVTRSSGKFDEGLRKAVRNTPAPIRPVGGSSTKSSVPLDELPYSEYRKLRDQQEKNKYRR